MTKRTKQVLFYSAVAVFLVLSFVIILYAQGYKYSFSDNRFFKTGAVYLKVNTDADVYLNDRLLGDTSFFNNSYRIEGLLPDRYTIRVQKEDYSTWQKSVTVDEGFVSEFSKILLISKAEEELEELNKETKQILSADILSTVASPSAPFVLKRGLLSTNNEETRQLANNVWGFEVSEDSNKLMWWTSNEVWVMWLNDANYQPYHESGDKELITRFSTQIKKVAWFKDEDHLIINSAGYKILEIDTRGGINIIEI